MVIFPQNSSFKINSEGFEAARLSGVCVYFAVCILIQIWQYCWLGYSSSYKRISTKDDEAEPFFVYLIKLRYVTAIKSWLFEEKPSGVEKRPLFASSPIPNLALKSFLALKREKILKYNPLSIQYILAYTHNTHTHAKKYAILFFTTFFFRFHSFHPRISIALFDLCVCVFSSSLMLRDSSKTVKSFLTFWNSKVLRTKWNKVAA